MSSEEITGRHSSLHVSEGDGIASLNCSIFGLTPAELAALRKRDFEAFPTLERREAGKRKREIFVCRKGKLSIGIRYSQTQDRCAYAINLCGPTSLSGHASPLLEKIRSMIPQLAREHA